MYVTTCSLWDISLILLTLNGATSSSGEYFHFGASPLVSLSYLIGPFCEYQFLFQDVFFSGHSCYLSPQLSKPYFLEDWVGPVPTLLPGSLPQRFCISSCSLRQGFIISDRNFKLSVSNPKSKYVACLSVLSRISNCQGLGRKNEHGILKTYRNLLILLFSIPLSLDSFDLYSLWLCFRAEASYSTNST